MNNATWEGGNCTVLLQQKDDGQKLAYTNKCRGLWKLWKLDNAIMWRKGLCFITNAVSSASNLGYVLSRVCMLHDQSPSTGLIGSVMTKAISIETALLVSFPAEWPAAPHRCAFIFWYNKLIAINLIKAAREKKCCFSNEWKFKPVELAFADEPQTMSLHKNCRTINSVLIYTHTRGFRHRRVIYQEDKRSNWCNYDLF